MSISFVVIKADLSLLRLFSFFHTKRKPFLNPQKYKSAQPTQPELLNKKRNDKHLAPLAGLVFYK